VCTLMGHSGAVKWVEFSNDGAQVVSASVVDSTVRFFDVASGRQVDQLAADRFVFVEGISVQHKRDRHIITAINNTLQIYESAREQQHAKGGVVGAPLAFFKAPHNITSVQCVGATICVGCHGGAVCLLSAPFLAA